MGRDGTGETPRVVLLGCGYWGKNLARVLKELGALTAICDPSEEIARGLAEQLGVAWYPTLAALPPDLGTTAVAIATPAATHYTYAREALLSGLDVFAEKPIALDLNEAQELATLARQHGRVLMVGHLLQYHPAFLRMKEIVDNGSIGRLQYAYSNRLNIGRLRREENVLWSFAPHDISMILALAGEAPETVSAVGSCYLHKTIADVTITHLSFRTGFNAHVHVSWLHPFKEQKLVVVGEEGMLVFDDTQDWAEKLLLHKHKVEWRSGVPVATRGLVEPVAIETKEPLLEELRHFLECVATRRQPRTNAEEAIRVLGVLSAAQRSMETQAAEPLPSVAAPAPKLDYFVHETALLDPEVEVGAGTKIWHFSHVLSRSRVGAGCSIGQNCMIGPDVSIGDNCKLQNNISVYKGVTLEDDVFCGPSMVFTNVLTPRANVNRKDEFAPTLIKRGATIGANATIVCGNTVGEYAMIGAGAVVTKDVPPYALVVGNPARRLGWVSAAGERLGPDLVCPRTGERYTERDGGIAPVAE